MTTPQIAIHNTETGEFDTRPMTAEELAQYEADNAAARAEKEAQASKTAARQAILDRLGLTQEEAALLLGAN
jgi:hypothetical protein